MGVLQTPKGFLPSKLHEVQLDSCPPPLPPPAHALFGRRKPLWRGRGRLFYTSHFKGGDGRQWRPSIADRGGSRDPPLWNPRGMVAPGFFFVLLKGRTCLPLWGRRCPVGTVLRRPNRQVRRCRRWRRKGYAWKFYRSRKKRGFAIAKWEFCKLPSGSCRVSCSSCNLLVGREFSRPVRPRTEIPQLFGPGEGWGRAQPRGRWGPMPGSPLMGGRAL